MLQLSLLASICCTGPGRTIRTIIEAMAYSTAKHPHGAVIEIVGISASDRGRSCDEHTTCGEVVEEDLVGHFRKIQHLVGDTEETAIAVYWVSDRIDRCRIGFLL